MTLVIENDPVPLSVDQDQVVRIGETRVKLHTVIAAFLQGAKPEDIVRKFPTLNLADVYAAIAYYLRHRSQVDEYLAHEEAEAEQLRREVETRFPTDGIKERLLARLEDQS